MTITNILNSGHSFSEDEHELKTKYILINSILFIVSVLQPILGLLRFLTNYPTQSLINFTGAILSILGIIVLRKLKKGNYTLFTYIMYIAYATLLIYAYYNNPLAFNVHTWFIVLGLPLFIILGFNAAICLSLLFMVTISIVNYHFIQSDLQNLVYGFVPIFVGVWFMHIYASRLQDYVLLLQHSNNTLEDTVQRRTKILEEQHKILDYQAHYDALTHLPNRVKFQKEIKTTLEEAKINKKTFALLLIDLDKFKKINDTYGHDIGDQVLRITASRIQGAISKRTLARIGGDEFTVLVEDYQSTKDLEYIASKIITTVHQPIIIKDTTMFISCSIGMSLYPNDTISSQDMCKYADTAMYKAKEINNGQYKFYSSDMTEVAFEKVLLETSMRFALEKEEFILHYQPQVDAITNEIIGLEALLRWDHEGMGLVPPSTFIPLAEETGIIIELDQWVMKTAMCQMREWYEKGLNPGQLSLNLSMKQLQEKNLIDIIENLLKETKCKAEWIEFEVTESQIMHNVTDVIQTLNKMKNLGHSIAIDDFGTGYSSLAYLKKLPINKLKIDRSFIIDIPDNKEDAAITNAIIAIAKSLDLLVIAEGVETKRQNDYLIDCECRYIQGHYHYKAMSHEDISRLL